MFNINPSRVFKMINFLKSKKNILQEDEGLGCINVLGKMVSTWSITIWPETTFCFFNIQYQFLSLAWGRPGAFIIIIIIIIYNNNNNNNNNGSNIWMFLLLFMIFNIKFQLIMEGFHWFQYDMIIINKIIYIIKKFF